MAKQFLTAQILILLTDYYIGVSSSSFSFARRAYSSLAPPLAQARQVCPWWGLALLVSWTALAECFSPARAAVLDQEVGHWQSNPSRMRATSHFRPASQGSLVPPALL